MDVIGYEMKRLLRVAQLAILAPWIFVVASMQLAILSRSGITVPTSTEFYPAVRFIFYILLVFSLAYIPAEGYYLLWGLIWKGASRVALNRVSAWKTIAFFVPLLLVAVIFSCLLLTSEGSRSVFALIIVGPAFLLVGLPNIYMLYRELRADNNAKQLSRPIE